MSPKPATISLALILLSLSVSLSSATIGGNPSLNFATPAEALRHFGLPGGLFPAEYKHFHLDPINDDGEATITVELDKICNVTRSLSVPHVIDFKQTVECQKIITAKISEGHLREIQGVKVYTFTPKSDEVMTVSQVDSAWGIFWFKSYEGQTSPPFLKAVAEQAPECDSEITIKFNGMLNIVEEKKQEFSWINYRRPFLQLVA